MELTRFAEVSQALAGLTPLRLDKQATDRVLHKYATFKRAVRRQKYHVRVVGHVDHLAGDQMYIDYAGDKLEVVDAETGEVRCVEVFVAILPCSHYTYCEAVWSQKKEDLIVACENALHFFGGAPMAIVPDRSTYGRFALQRT